MLTKETFLKGGKLGYSKAQAEALIAEVNDSNRVSFICEEHSYVPDLLKAPIVQCEKCWQAYLYLFLGSMPPHLRDQIADALQEFAHKTVENPLGYIQYEHPEIDVQKG